MKVLITGGAGYIGSTIASYLQDTGIEPIILDSLVTGKKEFTKNKIFYEGDIADKKLLKQIFTENKDIYCTIHCAAIIVVPESVAQPYKYYKENVVKSLELFHNLIELGQNKIIFSSSASIYDNDEGLQVNEKSPLKANCPYANTKIIIENILEDFSKAYDFKVISLRYFNPVGADPKFRSGSQLANPSHLLGVILKTQATKENMPITGVDWETRDGTAIRDYVHVWDLARAHMLALEKFEKITEKYCVINLGSEKGATVLEFIQAFENVIGYKIAKENKPRRPGDVIGGYASSQKAYTLLNWKAELSIEQGIKDTIAWTEKRKNILGY
ncbi:MAG: UDP-glucose 4-epimerase GalE [Candidatus Magasanikbacteria bacterium]